MRQPELHHLPRDATDNTLKVFRQKLARRFHLRLHMTVILAAVCLSGVVASRLLLELGISSMLLRYPLAAACSYSIFFLLIRMWLLLLQERPASRPRAKGPALEVDPLDAVWDIAGNIGKSGHSYGGSVGDAPSRGTGMVYSPGHRGAGSGSSGDRIGSCFDGIDLDLDGEGVIVLVALALLLVAIFGAAIYVIYQAPVILSEAAFQVMLAAGLVKASGRICRTSWIRGVLRATWIPFVAVVMMTLVFGSVVAHYRPDAVKMSDVFHQKAGLSR